MSEPIEFVGGQPDGERPTIWPYVAFGAVVLLLVAAAVILWGPIRSAGRGLGTTVAPYALVISGAWSADEKVAGVPISLVMTVENTDVRTAPGITIQMAGLTPGWQLLSTTPAAEVSGSSMFFNKSLATGKSEVITIKLLPLKAGQADIDVVFSVGRQGHRIETLLASAQIRNPGPSDLNVDFTTAYNLVIPVGSPAVWAIGMENKGLVGMKTLTVKFRDLPSSFDVTGVNMTALVSDNGRTLRFETATLDPGGKREIAIQVLPHAQGTFQVILDVYPDDASDPVLLPSGAPPVRFNVTVGPVGS